MQNLGKPFTIVHLTDVVSGHFVGDWPLSRLGIGERVERHSLPSGGGTLCALFRRLFLTSLIQAGPE